MRPRTAAGRPSGPGGVRPSRRRRAVAGVLALLLLAVGVGAGVLVGRAGGDGAGASADGASVEDASSELAAAEVARDAENLGLLREEVLAQQVELVPVMAGLQEALPSDGTPGVPADPADVAAWAAAADRAVTELSALPSGSTGYNGARSGFVVAAEVLASSVAAYEAAPAADPGSRSGLLALAADLRGSASSSWEVAAGGLDVLSVQQGAGHLRVYLPEVPTEGNTVPEVSGPEEGEGAGGGPGEGGDGHDH